MFVTKLSTQQVLMVVFGILLSDFRSAQGIKCYSCDNCNGKGEETECIVLPGLPFFPRGFPTPPPGFRTPPPGFRTPPPGFPAPPPGFPAPPPGTSLKMDRCLKQESKSGVVGKGCSNEFIEYYAKIQDFKCDDFGNLDAKICFCTTDLCNKAPSSFTGYSKRQLFFTVSAYFVVLLLF